MVDAPAQHCGWLRQCGPTKQYAWRARWFVLTATDLSAYRDETQKERLAIHVLRPGTRAVRFSVETAPGESAKYRSEKPCGFVLDLPLIEGRGRSLHYFDAEQADKLRSWLEAISQVVRRIAIPKDLDAEKQKRQAWESAGRELIERTSGVAEAQELLCCMNALQTLMRDRVRLLESDAAGVFAAANAAPGDEKETQQSGRGTASAAPKSEVAVTQGGKMNARFDSLSESEKHLVAKKLLSTMGTLQAFVDGTVKQLGVNGEHHDPYNIGDVEI